MRHRKEFLTGRRINPRPTRKNISVEDSIAPHFQAYRAARFTGAARTFSEGVLAPNVNVGLSITGTLSPAGLGMLSIAPLMMAEFVDWIAGMGASMFHDLRFTIGC
jgi:deoxyhypusine synthase